MVPPNELRRHAKYYRNRSRFNQKEMLSFTVLVIHFGLIVTLASSAPQYSHGLYSDYGYPSDYDRSDYWNSNSWFNSEPDRFYSLPDEDLVPPIYNEYGFRFDHPEQVVGEGFPLERGRSDIDPIEDNEGLGYFYPRPKIAFDLPKPLDGTADSDTPDESTETATVLADEETTVTTTAALPPSSSSPPPTPLPTSATKKETESVTDKP